MAKNKISKDEFMATIGYDGLLAVVSKTELNRIKGKTFDEILASNNFRAAAACAIYENDQEKKQKVVDFYNKATGSSYNVGKLSKLFGIAEPKPRKVLHL